MTVFWFRRDLRLEDNHGLYQALQNGETQLVFIFDKDILERLEKSDARVTFIYQQLKEIDNKARAHGSSLKIYHGDVLTCWQQIIKELNPKRVFYNHDYEPYAIERDKKVVELLEQNGIEVKSYKDQVIFEKSEIVKQDQTPYTVYTPYKNKWLSLLQAIAFFPSENRLDNLSKSNYPSPELQTMGFTVSKQVVRPFQFDTLQQYDQDRDFPDKDNTSYLSVHLRFGTISVRKALERAQKTNQVLVNELIWREFFMQILYHFPYVVTHNFKRKYDRILWRNNEEEFHLWCQGKTGYPIVDAGMRQLNETGYMHNRVRMITASFLVKHLLIDWRWGEAYFASKLLDYDLSANNGNWQWAAGTGCDAAPYFRIFNPTSQTQKFDKNRAYIKKWVKDIDELTYPLPIVDHSFARNRCLAAYKEALQ